MKHIVFVAVEVKPLVLRDFLNEIYSESSRMVNRERERDEYAKQLY